MIGCPKGILLDKYEVKEMVRALGVAIEEREVMMNSCLPPKGVEFNEQEKADERTWRADVRRWTRLRDGLQKVTA